uniref:C2H2-type domain-containing protein n=1 Tax=Leptobrachium leishanense TaxID=445787 RepID=A0A8C5PXA7_9ANUR
MMKSVGSDKMQVAERILNHALGIIYLLTGEEYVILKKTSPHSSVPLVTGEVPVKCGDVSVYFSMEEWDFIEGHKDIYKELIAEEPELQTKAESPAIQEPEDLEENIETISISEEDEEEGDDGEEDIQVVEINTDSCAATINHEGLNATSHSGVQEGQTAVKDIEQVKSIADTCRDGSANKKALEESHVAEFIEMDGTVHPSSFRNDYGGMSSMSSDPLRCIQITNVSSTYRSFECKPTARALNATATSNVNAISMAAKPTGRSCIKVSPGAVASADHSAPAPGKLFSCNECGKDFDYRSNLIKHQRVHAAERPLGHSESGGQSAPRPMFTAYQRPTGSRKRHRCNLCGKQFTYKSQFTTHLRTHTGEKPHSCNQCGKHFAYKSYLITHQRIHSGERPHTCPHCGRCFTDKSNLRKHQSTHSEERPYTCLKCGKHFYSKYNFTAHQRLHMERPHVGN